MAEIKSPSSASAETGTPEHTAGTVEQSSPSSATPAAAKPPTESASTNSAPSTFPPPKTDKPRPHVCTTCMRSFARLEHLKRHERSHTKEKPFECPSCTRCFARRDLLLRHQQKLHSTTTPSSKPRNARRESTAGVASGRVRKNSIASATSAAAAMRPRANTLSHVDAAGLGMMSSGAYGRSFVPTHHHHNSLSGLNINPGFGFRGMPSHNGGMAAAMNLPRIETAGLPHDISSGLRTAPPFGGFGMDFEMGGTGFDIDNGNTINPHALHMHGMHSFSTDGSFDVTQHAYSNIPTSQAMMEDDGFDWMAQGFENQMSFAQANEHAIDDSSPSAMSTNSPHGFHDGVQASAFLDNGAQMGAVWQPSVSIPPHVVNSPLSMDVSSFFGDVVVPTSDTISPKSLLAQKASNFDVNFPTPPDLSTMDAGMTAAMSGSTFTLPFKHEHIASTASTASADSSLRQSSVTTNSSELVNEHMRNMLVTSLSQNSGFGQSKQAQPTVSSPLSSSSSSSTSSPSSKSKVFNSAAFPSTLELQRYVSAYIKFFHPHLPFLHIPTLNFDPSEHSLARRFSNAYQPQGSTTATGGGCLMLSMAAMGALFEDEMAQSRELFDCAKRLISMYLEERRKQNTHKGHFAPYQRSESEDTPLWLVQAMLLNVIYGHNCGDKTAADIASTHCAALVSLARGAELAKPYGTYDGVNDAGHTKNFHSNIDAWDMLNTDNSDGDWTEWKTMEERKRTLYAIFIMSSLLVTAYNRAPALTNSEIRLDLPCEEDLWAAGSSQAWRAQGGRSAAESGSVQFATALTHLLTAAQRQRRAAVQPKPGDHWGAQEQDLRPSSFGCLVLINALHNYIWETRQRHLGRQWTPQEIDSMHAHIEPALRAWQTAWNSNPTHAVERPNPFGAGPLSADSVPLLDLAYVRLFIDFGRSKEAYWQRDYDAMAQELAKGSTIATSPAQQSQNQFHNPPFGNTSNASDMIDTNAQDGPRKAGPEGPADSRPSLRERHLRKAASYAADHLAACDRFGGSLNEQNARELPMQSILCACDSAQVLAEWATTLQERVGRYIGVLGQDDVDLTQVAGALLLDDGDRKLLGMIDELLVSMESQRDTSDTARNAHEGGYGSRILIATSQKMTRAAVWPVTKLMARSLETQAGHVKTRALQSTQAVH